jgi:amino-acid N-acetyltransferase
MTRQARITLKTADASQAAKLHALITAQQEEGHLLPRTLDELSLHADRFVIAVKGRGVVGCGELAPLSPHVAEVRSLAIDPRARHQGAGASIVEELRQRAKRAGYEKLCAFTHTPGYFIRMGFSIVPHMWVMEKIVTDCLKCPRFRQCGQYAMMMSLDDTYVDGRPAAIPLRLT